MIMNNLTGGIGSLLHNRFNPMMMADADTGGAGESTETATTTTTTPAEAPGWTKGLTADLQTNEYFTSMAKVSDLAEDALSMREKLKTATVKPGENATDEEKTAYRESLGIPKTKDDYNFGDLADNEFLGWYKGEAHKLNMSQDDAANLVGSFNKYVVDAQTREKEANNKVVESNLRNEWGDGYEARITKANLFGKKYGGDDFKANDLGTIKLLDTFAGLVSEDSFGGGIGGQGGSTTQREPGQLPFSKSFPNK
jgi:hypothetical protein